MANTGSGDMNRDLFSGTDDWLALTPSSGFVAAGQSMQVSVGFTGAALSFGEGEHILLPTIATLLERDFAEHGVFIVNVGNTGLGRFARIFQRRAVAKQRASRFHAPRWMQPSRKS